MNIWFWSDTHFYHFNIIHYENRPFKSVEHMNSTIINKFNERVKKDDLVFFLGDFNFKTGSNRGEGEPIKPQHIINQLNCKNIHFISGNHDNKGRNGLKTPIQSIILKHGGIRIHLVHNPFHTNFNCPLNIVGHVHSKWKSREFKNKQNKSTFCINVSVEQWNYYPVSWQEIDSTYKRWMQNAKTDKKR